MNGLGWPECVCNGPGVKTCGIHPEHRVRTKEESIAFRKEWDARVSVGSSDGRREDAR